MEPVFAFSKPLSQTDIAYRFAIPTKYLPRFRIFNPLNTNTFDVPVVDSSGHEWTFRCYTRPENHPKPVFCHQWLHFVRNKDLLVDDEVIFYEEVDETGRFVRFRVEVERKRLRLFNNVMMPGQR